MYYCYFIIIDKIYPIFFMVISSNMLSQLAVIEPSMGQTMALGGRLLK
jgi:hypothetical protein